MQLDEIEQLLDKNLYGDLSSRDTNRMMSPKSHESSPAKAKISQPQMPPKDLYEVMVDLAIFIIVKLSSPVQVAD